MAHPLQLNTGAISGEHCGGEISSPHGLVSAQFIAPAGLDLVFADGFHASLDIRLLEMPLASFDWSALRIAPDGNLALPGIAGNLVPIDAATLRYLVDPNHQAKINASLKELQLSRDELQELARDNPPPDTWYEGPERDLTRDSWK